MPRGTQLTEIEQQRIMDLKRGGMTQRQIARELNRSQGVVKNFLICGPDNYGKNKRSGRPPKFSKQVKRAVLREISKTGASSAQIVRRFNLGCDASLVRKWITQSKFLKYCKANRKPQLKKHHLQRRLQFAENHIQDSKKWSSVIFSDEKKFNLDGPDGFNYYWHDLRKEKKMMSRRSHWGGGVMVWAAFNEKGKSQIAFISGKMNAISYQNVLQEFLFPFITLLEEEQLIFQQDNAPIHTARSTKQWLQDFGINILDWPPLSPDLNPIENLWGIMAREIYDIQKPEIQNLDELKERITQAWENIPESTLINLVRSVPKRLLQALKVC
ncbi:hypothetical protein O3M35_008083 [Rhynocoris fuscipes]|uniref:Tc1-like transposase DDE domain-containing protein n=1 Tax=Rhynocoris fuscipes TaxID=488301 RepID=A0AAW1DCL0_9HEMI